MHHAHFNIAQNIWVLFYSNPPGGHAGKFFLNSDCVRSEWLSKLSLARCAATFFCIVCVKFGGFLSSLLQLFWLFSDIKGDSKSVRKFNTDLMLESFFRMFLTPSMAPSTSTSSSSLTGFVFWNKQDSILKEDRIQPNVAAPRVATRNNRGGHALLFLTRWHGFRLSKSSFAVTLFPDPLLAIALLERVLILPTCHPPLYKIWEITSGRGGGG